jgi:fructosamine-3-kinase
VTINKLNGWLSLGLIGTTIASYNSCSDPTNFGWTYNNYVYVAGQSKQSLDGWTRFTEGECLHFVLKETKLMMFSVSKNLRFVIEGVPSVGEKFVHFNFYQPSTKITLEPLSESEFDKVVS